MKLLHQCPHLLSEQLQGFRRRRILNVVNAPIVRNVLPLREPLSHQWSMFCFFNRNHKVGARQVGSRTLQREPVGAPSSDFQLFERTQRNRRDTADVIRPAFQRETARMRYPINAAALGVMIE